MDMDKIACVAAGHALIKTIYRGFRASATQARIKESKIYFLRYCHRREKFTTVTVTVQPHRISSVGTALDCIGGGRGFNSRNQTNTQGLKISEK